MDQQEKARIGRAVRAAREARGMKQHELAAAAGVSTGTIGNVETGKTLPQPHVRMAIARTLGSDVFGEARAEELRDGWPADVRTFVNVFGQFLAARDEETRARYVAKWMGDVLEDRRSGDVG